MRKRFFLFLYLLVLLWLVAAIVCMKIPPAAFWPAGFVALSLPGALLLNLLFLLYWALRRSAYALLPFGIFCLCWGYYQRGFSLGRSSEVPEKEAHQKLEVLNYNVRVFNIYGHLRPGENDFSTSKAMIEWLMQHPAGVLCLQEYYNEKGARLFNTNSRIGKQQGRQVFFSQTLENHIGGQFGMAIFSKYPILDKGTISFGKLTQNHAMYADLKLPHDTLRVYNVHFQSMSIEEQEVQDTYRENAYFNPKGKRLMGRLKRGMMARSKQVQQLAGHIKACPYPVVLCGDLNDLPYSYTYDHLSRFLDNAFTAAGSGIGTTYNGSLPFLRIDNQFYRGLNVHSYKMDKDMKYSDHFPISVVYTLPQK